MSDVYRNGGMTITVFPTFTTVVVMIQDDEGGFVMLLNSDARFIARILNDRINELDKPKATR